MDLVVVTGASGYLAGHVINQLLEQGFRVRGTVRSLKDDKKNQHIYNINPKKKQFLELAEAELSDKDCWDPVIKGAKFVCHVASPFPPNQPKDENEIIRPAKDGTENVFLASIRQKVTKIVITSSVAAIYSGRMDKNYFDESDWADKKRCEPYEKSKAIAEETAWNIFDKFQDKIQMTVINPGPSFHGNDYTSNIFLKRVLMNNLPGIPKVSFGFVDVRDVAFAHVQALIKLEETNGKRYILCEHSYWFEDIINILREEFQPKGYKLPSMTVGDCCFKCVALFDKEAKLLKPYISRLILFNNRRSMYELGIKYRTCRETIIDMAYDLIEKGVVKNLLKTDQLLKKQQ